MHPVHPVHRPTDTARPALLDLLRRTDGDPGRRILFTGATVVTMDPALGTLATGDLLVAGSTVAAVGPDLRAGGEAADAVVVDASGTILAPGFVDTHRHAWQGQLRRIIPDVDDLAGYVGTTLARYAPVYRPEDMYVGTRLAALGAVDAGITTMLDFSHNSRTAEHSDAAVQALLDSGIRGIHAAMGPHFGDWDRQWPADLGRLVDRYGGGTGLVTFRLAALATAEIAGPALAFGPGLARVAAELGVGVSVDAVFGRSSSAAVLDWEREGLLGERLTLIHATGLTGEAWRAIGASGTRVSLAPTSEAQIGLEDAVPAVDEALAAGIRPGLSIDVEVALAGDMFTQMRALHAIQRMRAVNAVHAAHDAAGADGPPDRITTADVLDFATRQGAATVGLAATTGTLTPGKQADLLMITADEINNLPLNDPIGTVVLGADARNIDTVLIAGRVRKWAGRLLDVDLPALRAEAAASPRPRPPRGGSGGRDRQWPVGVVGRATTAVGPAPVAADCPRADRVHTAGTGRALVPARGCPAVVAAGQPAFRRREQPVIRPKDSVHLDRAARCSPPEDQRSARTYDLHLLPEYHALVANGTKTVEVRTASPAKALIRPGDRIVFRTDHDRPVTCKVLRVDRYSGFEALLDREDPATINPAADRDGILAALRGIYPPEKEQLGALAIEVVLLVAGHP